VAGRADGEGGRKAGSVPDYDYSPAMKASATVWSADTLAAFVLDPTKAMPGNKMDYDGADAAAAKTIADYLMTLKP
jgi:cytochrome c